MTISFFFDSSEITKEKPKMGKSFIADPCILCGLNKDCISPKMKPFGDCKKGIFILGEAPGAEEDKVGRGFVGNAGKVLRKVLESFNIDMDKDCIRSNVLQCRPKDNKFIPEKVEYCSPRLDKQIFEIKPKLIIAFGEHPVKRLLNEKITDLSIGILHSNVFPSKKYNCWIACCYHPAASLYDPELIDYIYMGIEHALHFLDIPQEESFIENDSDIVVKGQEAVKFLLSFKTSDIIYLDYETSRLSPFQEDSYILSVALSLDEKKGVTIPLFPKDEMVWKAFQQFLDSNPQLVCHSGKFEQIWTRQFFSQYVGNRVWDTQLATHILDERPDTKSLAFQTYLYTGETYKEMLDRSKTVTTDKKTLYKYNSIDARATAIVHKNQINKIIAENLDYPNNFLLQGDDALARLEYNGVQINEKAFKTYREEIDKELKNKVQELRVSSPMEKFNRKNGRQPDINSTKDMRDLFFTLYQKEPISYTGKGTPQVNDELFKFYEDDEEMGEFCKIINEYKALSKMKTTYIPAIENNVDSHWILHPTYNLWTTRTYRSSCDNPNLQNIPKRDENQAEFRKIFVPRYDYLLDADHKGSEVVVQALLAKDKTLINQLKNGLDPHKYWASRLFQVSEDNVTKKQRYISKNSFVFPLIYGSYYVSIAKNTGLDENHVKLCQEEFFAAYIGIEDYQNEKIREYNKYGYVTTPLGFRRHGPLSRNQIINFPIQATSFHYLLDTLTIFILKILPELKMKSLPVLQIHDDVVIDTVEEEISDIIAIINELTEFKPHFPFMNQGLSIQVDWSQGKNWLEMEAIK